jgi:hypothetical protein
VPKRTKPRNIDPGVDIRRGRRIVISNTDHPGPRITRDHPTRSPTMSTTPTQTHTYTTGAAVTAALAAAVTPGQMANVLADATRPAIVEVAKKLDVYTGHSRDTRTDLEGHVLSAYVGNRIDAETDATPPADTPITDAEFDADAAYDAATRTPWTPADDTPDTPDTPDTAAAIVALVDRSRTAHNADAARPRPVDPAAPVYDTGDAPAPRRTATTGGPRANAARTFVSADHDTYTCIGHCGRTMPVTAFFPLVKGAAVRSQECSRCIDERRAIVNPASTLGARTMDALARRMARPNPDPAPVGYVAPPAPIVPGRDTV